MIDKVLAVEVFVVFQVPNDPVFVLFDELLYIREDFVVPWVLRSQPALVFFVLRVVSGHFKLNLLHDRIDYFVTLLRLQLLSCVSLVAQICEPFGSIVVFENIFEAALVF